MSERRRGYLRGRPEEPSAAGTTEHGARRRVVHDQHVAEPQPLATAAAVRWLPVLAQAHAARQPVRPQLVPPRRRGPRIDRAAGHHDAVEPVRLVPGAQPAADVHRDALGISLEWIAVAATAGAEVDPGVARFQPGGILGLGDLQALVAGLLDPQGDPALGEPRPHAGAAEHDVALDGYRQAPENALGLHVAGPRREEHRLQRARRLVGDDHVLEPHATAVAAGPRRLLALAAVDVEHGDQRLDALDVRDAVGGRDHVAAGVDAVPERAGAAAAHRVREHVDEGPPVSPAPAEDGHVDPAVTQRDDLVAQVGRASVHARHGLPDQVAGGLAGVHRGHAGAGREDGVVEGAGLGDDGDAILNGAVRPRQIEAEEREQHLEDAAHQAAPRAVDRAHRLLGRPGEVEGEVIAPLGQGQFEPVEVVGDPVVVEQRGGVPDPVGKRGDAPPHGCPHVVDHLPLHGDERLLAVLADDLAELLVRDHLGGDLGPKVERVDLGRSRVAEEHRLHVAPHAAGVHDLHRGRERHLLVRVAGPHAPAARAGAPHVQLVDDHAGPRHALPVPEERRHHRRVHGVEGAVPGIAGQEHVAVVDVLPEAFEDRLDHQIEGRSLADDVHAGEEATPVRGQDRGVEVAGLVDGGRPRDAAHGEPHLVVDLPQAMAEHLEGHEVDSTVCLLSHRGRPATG